METERRRIKMQKLGDCGQRKSAAPLGLGSGVEDHGGPIDYVCGCCDTVVFPGREELPAGHAGVCEACGARSEIALAE
jgi:hypothetical protein